MKKLILLKYFQYIIISFFLAFISNISYSVPTSFLKTNTGNMRDTEWERLESSHFSIYYPKESKNIGKYSLYSAEISYPYLSLLLGVKLNNHSYKILDSQKDRTLTSKFERVPYILGNISDGAGFANPVSLNIEAQILHSRTASFFQHELVHRLMYEHNDFHIGPAGRIFSLAMFPSWWIEGLAEYLTESIGKDLTDNVTRYMAIQNYWPSWDRIHALYNADGDTNTRGYVTSGRFLGWIFQKAKEKDLYKIHEQISKDTIIPPFYNASDAWLQENIGKSGDDLYEDFKKDQKLFWEDYLKGMPSLVDQKTIEQNENKFYYPNYNFENYSIYSKLVSDSSPYESSLYFKDFNIKKEIRIPLSINGSPVFDISNQNNGTFLTTNLKKFSNGKMGHELILFSFKGELAKIANENIFNKKHVAFSNDQNPIYIDQIQYLGMNHFAISASKNGDPNIYLFNSLTNELKYITQYHFPTTIKFIKNYQSENTNCIYALINNDLKGTSIDKVCENGEKKEFISKNILHMKDAFILKDGTLRALVSWDRVMSFVDYSPNKQIKPIAAFPDLIESIGTFSQNTEKYITAWVYKAGKYDLQKIDLDIAKENFKNWQLKQDKKSNFLNFPNFENYLPPYLTIFNKQKEKLLANDLNLFENHINEELPKIEKIISEQNNNITSSAFTETPATYRSQFLFAYPYALPDFLGGPSIGLFAFPLSDEMERYRVQIFGGYNFFLNAPSGSITYINNRFLDSFSLSLFATPFFNGYYETYSDNSKTRYYNYLQQTGLSTSGSWIFRPFQSSFQSTISIYNLSTYSNLTTAPKNIGAQNTYMTSATGLFTFNLFNTGFYLAKKTSTNAEWLNWFTDISFGTGKYNGLGDGKDSAGNNTGTLDYYNLNSSINSTFKFYKQNLSLLGKISTTQGENTLNIKEIYSPNQTYILGSTTSLNYVSYPIIGSGSLFELKSGYWSYSGTISYDFPIYPSFEKKFLITFLDNLRGFVSLTRGGVSSNKDFSTYDSLTSASIGSSMDIDIKGFQLYPALSYGWIVGQENNWFMLLQIKFMDLL